jgi:hypothetical protein
MREEGVEAQRVRFLPAGRLPGVHLRVLVSALEEVCSARRTDRLSAGFLRLAAAELLRHGGDAREPCFITRDAVFEVSELLEEASSRLSMRGRQAGALVALAVRDRLIEAITDPQPVAPS